jgi:hypothetical protein
MLRTWCAPLLAHGGDCHCQPLMFDSCLAGGGEACVALACVAAASAVVVLGALNTLRFVAMTLQRAVATTVGGLDTFVLDIDAGSGSADDELQQQRAHIV